MLKNINSVIKLLDITAERSGGKTAVVDGDESVSFSRLRHISRSVGTYLLSNGCTNMNIAILLPKKLCAIVSFFGCLYSANTYVPLDYKDAHERIVSIVRNVGAPCVITDSENAAWLSEAGVGCIVYEKIKDTAPDIAAIDKALEKVCDLMPAYIMHTSGSTGEPKGVVVSHRGVVDFIQWITEYFALDDKSVIALQSPFHFDASVFDIYSCICVGAKIVIMPDILALFPAKIPAFLEENHITCIFWVPGLLADIANSGALDEYRLDNLRLFTFIGEVMPTRQLNMWIAKNPDREYINLYGPTEATVACSAYRIKKPLSDTDSIPIGRASENKRIVILNEHDAVCDINEVGELCILGSGLAMGYYGKKELTEKAFVQNPLNNSYNEMMYRTGDYGYVNEEGDIVFSGRRDTQVKVHGIRVELGDVENAACCIEGVEKACAMLDSDKKMILFLQTKEKRGQRLLKQLLKEHIPRYMIPDRVFESESFPVNKNGKIDRKQLLKSVEK